MQINPYVLEERLSNLAQLDLFSRLMSDRIIYIGSEINSEVANSITAQLIFLNYSDNKKPINLYINSPGGCVLSMNSILDTMDIISAPVYTTCIGFAASAASVILAHGEKGHRYAFKRSRIMIHQPSGWIGGTKADIDLAVKNMTEIKADLYKTLSDDTGRSLDEITDACDRDNWMSTQQAIEFGIIDSSK